MKIKNVLYSFFSLFYPRLCIGCSSGLIEGEELLCLECIDRLPKTNYHLNHLNRAYEQLISKMPLQRATCYLYYNKGGIGQKIVASIKYHGNIYLAEWIAKCMVKEINKSGFFLGIDYIIPIPLHKKRFRQRGYNQAEILAKGISVLTGIPLNRENLYRKKFNNTQTEKGIYDRWINTQGIFDIKDKDLFQGKHILLIDDVLTTGVTIEVCAAALLKTKNIKVSVLALAIA